MSEYEIKQTTVRLRERGQITVPQAVRDKWAAEAIEPDVLNLVEIGDVVFLTPKKLLLPELSKQFSALMDEEGVSLADLLEGLAEERQAIYQERYGGTS
ncbi:MAG: AbrB/MazE/SpoVT family DNA-binding domain-containing protein [Anaerolineaceae bacterium]|nr:AbrB/MazE/SpoVT family DNA-binding domain-containing protein [Anaerolineaceae bacterium]